MPKLIDLTGDRYGRLTVVARTGVLRKQRAYECLCDCGTVIIVPNSYLRTGDTRSCGCLRRDEVIARFTTHGRGSTATDRYDTTHGIWRAMLERCRLSSHVGFKNYGGRGITVCERWRKFENFLADMGERPGELTLDRIDVDGNYEPGNCRWATRKEQANNTRRTKALRCAEESKNLLF